MAKLDRSLNLAIPIQRDDGSTVHVFSRPITRATFVAYERVISLTYSQLWSDKLMVGTGAAVAAIRLENVAKETPRGAGTWWEGPDGVESGLLGEIRRLTNVLAPDQAGGGWRQIQYEDAVKTGVLTEDEAADLEGQIVFFTLASRMVPRAIFEVVMSTPGRMWGWQITSSTLSDYRGSLTTSTAAASTAPAATPEQLSIPH